MTLKLLRRIAIALVIIALVLVALLAASLVVYKPEYKWVDGQLQYITKAPLTGSHARPILGADVNSFEALTRDFGRDRQNVWFRNRRIAGADSATFAPLDGLYARDSARVYFAEKAIPGADPRTFVLLSLRWARDARDVYYMDRPVHACDPASFRLLEEHRGGWGIDAKCAYHQGVKLPGADAASLHVLSSDYAKDRHSVYYMGERMAGADAESFRIGDGACKHCGGLDDAHCYVLGEARPPCKPSK